LDGKQGNFSAVELELFTCISRFEVPPLSSLPSILLCITSTVYKEISIEERGDLKDTLQDILGGVRSTCTYIGALELRELSKCTTFIRVSQQYNPVYESKTI